MGTEGTVRAGDAGTPDSGHRVRPGGAATLFAVLALVAYGVVFYADILGSGRVYTFRDVYPLFLGLDRLARDLGALNWPPLWNDMEVLGRPFAADPEAGIFYPPNWLLRRFAEPLGFNLSILFHHIVAAWGAFALLRQWRLGFAATGFGALLFGFGGTMVALDNLTNALQSAAWLPWAALALERHRAHGGGRSLAGLSVALALLLLGGMPELLLVADLLLAALACDGGSGPGRMRWKTIGALAAANVLAAGLCAVLLVPFAEFVLQSTRVGGLDAGEVLLYSLQPLGPLLFVLPRRVFLPDGGLLLRPGAWELQLTRQPWLLTIYLGFAVVFAANAVPAASRRRRLLWIGLAVLLVVLAMGEHVPGLRWWVEHVPAARVVRFPEKLLIAVNAILVAAAAVGFEKALASPVRFKTAASVSLAASFFFAIVYAVAVWLGPAHVGLLLRIDLASQAVLFLLVALLARRGSERPARIGLALLALLAADLYRVNGRLLPTVAWTDLVSPPETLEAVQPLGRPVRIFSDAVGRSRTGDPRDSVLQEKNMLLQQSAGFFSVANVNAAAPVNATDRLRIEKLLGSVSTERGAAILAAFNVSHLSTPRVLDSPRLSRVRASADPLHPNLYRIEGLVPRAFVPQRLLTVSGDADAMRVLATATDLARDVAVPRAEVPADVPAAVAGAVRLRRYLPQRVELEADMETRGLVVLSDAFYPGWKATVNGRPEKIVRVNSFVRGVFAQAGKGQQIVFEYDPASYRVGLLVSLLCAGSLIVLCLRSRGRSESPGAMTGMQ